MPAPYAYLRKSVVKDATREVSHDVQLAAVKDLAKRHGDNGERLIILSDWDVSGGAKSLRKRMAGDYGRLVEAVKSGEATALYSYSLSRLGRSVKQLTELFELCAQRKVPVRLYADSIDTSTATGKLVLHVLASLAQFESDVASERTTAAIAMKKENGTYRSTPSYGDLPGESLDAVLNAFTEAGSYLGAANLLAARGVKPRRADQWWASAVRDIVRRTRPDLVARTPRRGERNASPGGAQYILSRLLRCGTCNRLLTGHTSKGGVRYYCASARVMGQDPDQRHARTSVSEARVLPAVREEVARLRVPDSIEIRGDLGRRGALGRRRERVLDLYEIDKIDRAEMRRRLERIDADEEQLDTEAIVQKVPRVDWDWDTRTLNKVLRALFVEIRLDADTFLPRPDGFEWAVREWRAD